MDRPEVWSLDRLAAHNFGKSAILSRPYLAERVFGRFKHAIIGSEAELKPGLDALIVIGGGSLIDRAKYWRRQSSPKTILAAVPSIWGSGAENSPIVVLNLADGKFIEMNEEYLPDIRAIWPELANTVPANVRQWGCGDAWAHAVEGLLSPLGSAETKKTIAQQIKIMLRTGPDDYREWFESSAIACAAQARSSVGLVHGIAHHLEHLLGSALNDEYISHARLCAAYLWPVMLFNLESSPKMAASMQAHELDVDDLLETAKSLYDDAFYDKALPHLLKEWPNVIRNPSSRTNCVLVRPEHADFYAAKRFL